MAEETRLEEILSEFPFSRRYNDTQDERLAEYLQAKASGNKTYVKNRMGVAMDTVQRIEKAFAGLDDAERAILINHLNGIIIRKSVENALNSD